MSLYYLMAQLPSLDGVNESTPLPITEERFYELCKRFLGKKAQNILNSLSLTPKRERNITSSPLVDKWNDGERELRFALAKVRANKLKKNFDVDINVSTQILNVAKNAVEMEDPMSAERYLNDYRLDFLETLRPMDAFSEDMVFYYGLKLKLILRTRQFDEIKGQNAYRSIYNSIMRGDEQEAIQ